MEAIALFGEQSDGKFPHKGAEFANSAGAFAVAPEFDPVSVDGDRFSIWRIRGVSPRF